MQGDQEELMAATNRTESEGAVRKSRRGAKITWGCVAAVFLGASGWVLYDPAIDPGLIPPEPAADTAYYAFKDIEAELTQPVPNPPILPPIKPGQTAEDYQRQVAPLWAPYRNREQERDDRLYARLKEAIRLPYRMPEAERERIARRDAAAFLGDISQLRPDQVADSGLTIQNISLLLMRRNSANKPNPDTGLEAAVTAFELDAKLQEDGGFSSTAGAGQAASNALQQFPLWIPKASLATLEESLRRMRQIHSRAETAEQTFLDERDRQLRFFRAFTNPMNWRRQMVSNFEMTLKDAAGVWMSHRGQLAKELAAYHDGWKRVLDSGFAGAGQPPKWPDGPVFHYLSLRDGTKLDAHLAYWKTLKLPDLNLAFIRGALAVEIAKRRSGRYPETAGALDRGLALPKDPFGHNPLCYQPKGDGYLLYSVGPDGKDDRGVPAGMIRSTLTSGLAQSFAPNDRGDVLYMGSNFDLVPSRQTASRRPVIRSKSSAD